RLFRRRAVFARDLAEPDRQIGADDLVFSFLEHEVAGRDFEVLRGKLHALFHHFARGDEKGAAVAHRRARADRADADQARDFLIADRHVDALGVDAEHAGDDFGIGGLVALARRPDLAVNAGVAVGAELDGDFFLGSAATRRLDEHGDTEAAQLAALFRGRAPRGEAREIGDLGQ